MSSAKLRRSSPCWLVTLISARGAGLPSGRRTVPIMTKGPPDCATRNAARPSTATAERGRMPARIRWRSIRDRRRGAPEETPRSIEKLEVDFGRELDDAIGSRALHAVDLTQGLTEPAGGRWIHPSACVPDILRAELLLRLVVGEVGSHVPGQTSADAAKVRVVERVEHLEPDLKGARTVATQGEVLEDREVVHVQSGVG